MKNKQIYNHKHFRPVEIKINYYEKDNIKIT